MHRLKPAADKLFKDGHALTGQEARSAAISLIHTVGGRNERREAKRSLHTTPVGERIGVSVMQIGSKYASVVCCVVLCCVVLCCAVLCCFVL